MLLQKASTSWIDIVAFTATVFLPNSLELFGMFFENLVLPEEIVPLYKPAYSLCFCSDLLLQFFPHNWCIICKVDVIGHFNLIFSISPDP